MPLFKGSYTTNLSPSTAVEKGAYRLRSSYGRLPEKDNSFKALTQKANRAPRSRLRLNQTTLIALLAIASISCFCFAYFLLVKRWDASLTTLRRSANYKPQVATINPQNFSQRPEEKFLAYLPHGGFHNQRIAFENALVLARLLNRTLLAPPVRLGSRPLHYQQFHALSRAVNLSDKQGLRHCSHIPDHIPLPLECADYFEYTQLPWDWVVDLKEVVKAQNVLQLWNISSSWLEKHLGVSEADTFTLADTSLYQYRFLDTLKDTSPPNHKFIENQYIPLLTSYPQRLIQVGTLFGSSRLRLRNKVNVELRATVRRNMVFSNPLLSKATENVVSSLGNIYLGAHLRVGDGSFRKLSNETVQTAWKDLLHVLNVTIEEMAFLKDAPAQDGFLGKSGPLLHTGQASVLHYRGVKPRLPELRCRGPLHVDSQFSLLNSPLYISTDAVRPQVDPLFSIFRKTFPCMFFVSDFHSATSPLMKLRNSDDGVALGNFLLPFLDAMVLGNARITVGTKGSTFSQFVEDILWPTFHGKVIMDRGIEQLEVALAVHLRPPCPM